MKKSLFALLLVVFIDSLGQGLFFPLLNTAIMSPSQGILAATVSSSWRSFDYGLVIGLFFLSWFFGATFLATASDTAGRKKALLVCLIGAFLGYALTIFAFLFNSMTLLLIGRVIAGLTAGSQSVAQAAILDLSTEDNKAKNLGLVLLAFSIGMVAGPVIGGVFSDSQLVSFFNLRTPFYVVLLIIIINIFLLLFFFKETLHHKTKFKLKISDAVMNFVAAFKHKKIRKISVVFFLMQISFNTFYIFCTAYLYLKFKAGTIETSAFMVVLGVALAITFGALVGPLSKILSPKQSVIIGLGLLAVFETWLVSTHAFFWPYILVIPMMIFFAIAYTSMLTLFSDSVTEDQQGWAMGISVSLFTLGAGIISVFGGALIHMDLNLPFLLSIIGLIVTQFLALLLLPR